MRSKKNKINKQVGGDGQGSRGHGYSFPIQYFGGKLNRYFPTGSSELVPKNGAYGETIATSFGKNVPSLYSKNMVGPNLAPFPNSSGIQTGGKKSKSKKSQNSKSKKSKSKKGGNILNDAISEASNLIVPVGLLATKKFLEKRQNKSKSHKSKGHKSKGNKKH